MCEICIVSKNGKISDWHSSIYECLQKYENDKKKRNCYRFEIKSFANVRKLKNVCDKFLEGEIFANK